MIAEIEISKIKWNNYKAERLAFHIGKQPLRSVAQKVQNVSHSAIDNLVKGKTKEVSFELIKDLAKALNVDINEFVLTYTFSEPLSNHKK